MAAERGLTDNEGALLALVLRRQPMTAYQIGKFFAVSPVHTFNTSKGKLYPMIRRLERSGMLAGEEVAGDQRGTQRFVCTEAGRAALRDWVGSVRAEHELLHDPLRKKMQAFDLLTRGEQLEWIETARAQLQAKLREVEAWPPETDGPFGDLIRDNARSALAGRIDWLERARARLDALAA